MKSSKKTLTYGGMQSMKSKEIVGNCHGDERADAWFPTTYNGGRPEVMFRNLLPDIQYALSKCDSCPIREKCLEEGMKPVNLALGIWGGKFAGERILMARERGINYLVPLFNKGRKTGPRVGDAWPEPVNGITMQEEEDALLFHQRVLRYLGSELRRERVGYAYR